jgi:2-dehydro-3-deoxyphosphogluconate aldolase/(4S)-4-hydroxy-2-oxoglutarate aldolase
MQFVPSGGTGIDNAADYVRDGVLAISTSWIAPRALITAGDFAEIARRGQLFLKTVRS